MNPFMELVLAAWTLSIRVQRWTTNGVIAISDDLLILELIDRLIDP